MKALALTSCAMLLIGCASKPAKTSEAEAYPARGVQDGVTTFTDTSHGLRLTYPGAWEQMEVEKDEAILVLSRLHDHVGMSMPPTVTVFAASKQKDPGSRDLASLEDDYVRKARGGVKNFHLVETADDTLGGTPARRIVYTGSMLWLNVKALSVITVHNGRPYVMMYLADPKRFDVGADDVRRMVESWEWMR